MAETAIDAHKGRIVKRTGDGSRIAFRVGVHLGDVVEGSGGDPMGDGVNIAARLEGVAKPPDRPGPCRASPRSRRRSDTTQRDRIDGRVLQNQV